MTEHNARLAGIKQEIQEFKAGFNSLLVDLKNEVQTKFENINNKFNEIENNIKSNITEQVNKSIISIMESITDALKEENKLLNSKVLNLEHELSQSEAHINNLDQYNRRNYLEIQGIPSNVSDDALEDKVINIFHSLNINVNTNDIEDCYRLGKADPKNTIVRFVNRKFCYEALDKKFYLRKVDSIKLGFQAGAVLYFSENLTPYNQRLAWKCREVKRASKIHSSWSNKGIVKLRRTINELPVSIIHDSDIADFYLDFVFREGQNQGGNR